MSKFGSCFQKCKTDYVLARIQKKKNGQNFSVDIVLSTLGVGDRCRKNRSLEKPDLWGLGETKFRPRRPPSAGLHLSVAVFRPSSIFRRSYSAMPCAPFPVRRQKAAAVAAATANLASLV